MSLQGSFQTIALPDVMTLLASSSKTGELRVVSGHVEGRLWLFEGHLVQSSVGKARGHVDAMFELLRLSDGNFVFRDGVEATEPEEPMLVGPVVRDAEARLVEWREIEAVVPSLEHRVRLVPELPAPEVTLSADQWQLVIAIALAGTVRGVVEELAVDYFDGCRGVKRLVDANLVLVEAPRVRTASESVRPSRRSNSVAPAPDGLASAERMAQGDDSGFSSLESLVTSPSVLPSAPTSPSLQSLVASANAAPGRPTSPSLESLVASTSGAPGRATSRSLESRLVTSSPAEPARADHVEDVTEPPQREIFTGWDLPKESEPIRLVRHEEPAEEETGLAVVRHLFLSSPEPDPEPAFDWQSWSRGASEPEPEPAKAAPVQASIRSLRPVPAGSERGDGTGTAAPSVLSPAGAPPLSRLTPIPLPTGSTLSPGLASLSAARPSPTFAPAPAPALAPAPAPTPVGSRSAPAAASLAVPNSGTSTLSGATPATPAAPASSAAAGRSEKDPDSINRGLLLKFLSSVKP